jgi:hypothetical protein
VPDRPSSHHSELLISAVILAAVGWPTLYLLLNATQPTVGPRWLFFFLLTLAVTGTTLPFVWMLRRRFAPNTPVTSGVLLRQGLWVGLYVGLLVWLQINRSLEVSLALLLGLALLAIEWLLRLMERSSWRPEG